MFEIQDEIAREVARRLSEHVKAGGVPRPVVRSEELDTYDTYLKARQLMAGFGPDAVMDAGELFEACTERDPDFAACQAGLAEALTMQSIGFQVRPDKETMPRARRAAERALGLDANLPEAHLARALVAMFYEWDHVTALEAFDRARELGPNVARVHMWREFYFTYVDHDFEAAMKANGRAQELSPLDMAPRTREAVVLYLFGHLDEAERQIRGMLSEYPEASILYNGLADTLVRQGRVDEAVAEMERAVETGGPYVAWLGILGGLYGLQGSTDRAREVLGQLEARATEGYVSRFWMAVTQAGIGDLDGAFESLTAAVEDRDSNLLYAFFVPRAMGLQEDPRLPAILRTVGLSHLIPLLEA